MNADMMSAQLGEHVRVNIRSEQDASERIGMGRRRRCTHDDPSEKEAASSPMGLDAAAYAMTMTQAP